MAWLKIDDGFAEHAKVSGLSDRAFRVHVAALCYCARNLTDGLLDQKAVNVVCAIVGTRSKTVVRELVSSALWHHENDAYRINDFTEYNPSADRVKRERQRNAERQSRFRKNRNGATDTVTDGATNDAPSRPLPLTTKAAVVGTTPPAPDPQPNTAAAAEYDDQDEHLRVHADSVELEQLLDDLHIPDSLRQRSRQDPARALLIARYTLEQNGNGGYYRTVYESGDTPVLAAESRVRAHNPTLRFAVAVRALVAGGADRGRVEAWLRDQTDDEATIEAHLGLVAESEAA